MSGIFGIIGESFKSDSVNRFESNIKKIGYKELIFESISDGLFARSTTYSNSFTYESKDIILTFEGEIYSVDGSSELPDAKSYIINLYEKDNLDLLKNLNGVFVFALYDKKNNRLIIGNDRFGHLKTYYYFEKNKLVFASKIKPIIDFLESKKINKNAMIDLFSFGYIIGGNTMIEGINLIPPSSIIYFSLEIGKIKEQKYWSNEISSKTDSRSSETLVNEMSLLWKQAVNRRIKKDEKIIIPLSGGIDSRGILAASLERTSRNNISTVTYGEEGSFDFDIGTLVSRKSGVSNLPLGVEKNDYFKQFKFAIDDSEGMVEATPYYAIKAYRELNSKYPLFSGYSIDVLVGDSHLLDTLPIDVLTRKIRNEKDFSGVKSMISNQHRLVDSKILSNLFDSKSNFKGNIEKTHKSLDDVIGSSFFEYFSYWDFTFRQFYLLNPIVLNHPERFKYYTILDNDLVDFALRIRLNQRLEYILYKKMMLNSFPELSRLPLKKNYGFGLHFGKTIPTIFKVFNLLKRKINSLAVLLVNKNIFKNARKNYIDYSNLLRTDSKFKSFVFCVLKEVKKRPYFSPKAIDEILLSHLKGRNDNYKVISMLITFEFFHREFID